MNIVTRGSNKMIGTLVLAVASSLFVLGDCKSLARARSLVSYPKAICLDGSPARYYIRQGYGSGRKKFLIFHEGGGFCTDDKDCAKRALGYFGSTVNDTSTISLDHPFFNQSKEANPLLWNWNHIQVRYCDGAYYSGARDTPIVVGDQTIHYLGEHITVALMADLTAHFGLDKASDIVFSGCSAGGIRTFAHLDALRSMVPESAKVVGFPDSGFYTDVPMFRKPKEFVVASDGQRATNFLNDACVADNTDAAERCLIGAVVAPYLTTPVFAWQSRYDTDQRGCEMTRLCSIFGWCVRAYGAKLTSLVEGQLVTNARNGVFLDSCSRHCQGPALPRDDRFGMNPTQAFAEWYEGGGQRVYRQQAPYPCDSCCSAATVDQHSAVV